MRKIERLIFTVAIFVSLTTIAAPAQRYYRNADTQFPERKLADITVLQNSTPDLTVYSLEDGEVFTNIAGYSCSFRAAATATEAAWIIVTNTSLDTAAGSFLLPFSASQTATNTLNTNGVQTSWWYTVIITTDGGRTHYSGWGDFYIERSTALSSTNIFDTTLPVNLDLYTFSGILPWANHPTNVASHEWVLANATNSVDPNATNLLYYYLTNEVDALVAAVNPTLQDVLNNGATATNTITVGNSVGTNLMFGSFQAGGNRRMQVDLDGFAVVDGTTETIEFYVEEYATNQWRIDARGNFVTNGVFHGDGNWLTNLNIAPYAGTNLTWDGSQLSAAPAAADPNATNLAYYYQTNEVVALLAAQDLASVLSNGNSSTLPIIVGANALTNIITGMLLSGQSSVILGDLGVIAGGESHVIGANADAATISGGSQNSVSGDVSTVSGGGGHTIGLDATYSTIPGGRDCAVADSVDYAVAMGRRAKANHDGAMVFSDSQNADQTSGTADQLTLRFQAGVRSFGELDVSGDIICSGGTVQGNGSGLTALDADNISAGTLSTARYDALNDLGGGAGTTFLRKDGTWTLDGSGLTDLQSSALVFDADVDAGGYSITNLGTSSVVFADGETVDSDAVRLWNTVTSKQTTGDYATASQLAATSVLDQAYTDTALASYYLTNEVVALLAVKQTTGDYATVTQLDAALATQTLQTVMTLGSVATVAGPIQLGITAASGTPAAIEITGGLSNGGNETGGVVNITGGAGFGFGGGASKGGNVVISGGGSLDDGGGDVIIRGGAGTSAGNVELRSSDDTVQSRVDIGGLWSRQFHGDGQGLTNIPSHGITERDPIWTNALAQGFNVGAPVQIGNSGVAADYESLRLIHTATSGGGFYVQREGNDPFFVMSGYDTGSKRLIGFGGGGWEVDDANEISFWTDATYAGNSNEAVKRMSIFSDGSVAIGSVNSADATLDVRGDAIFENGISVEGESISSNNIAAWKALLPTNVVRVSASGANYTSLKSALDYVLTQSPSSSNRWVVEIGPGVYTESPMTNLLSYIDIKPTGDRFTTKIVAADPSTPLFAFVGVGPASINNLSLNGVTSNAAVYNATASMAVQVTDCQIADCLYGLHSTAGIIDAGNIGTTPYSVMKNMVRIEGGRVDLHSTDVRSTASFECFLYASNGVAHIGDMNIEGPNVEIGIHALGSSEINGHNFEMSQGSVAVKLEDTTVFDVGMVHLDDAVTTHLEITNLEIEPHISSGQMNSDRFIFPAGFNNEIISFIDTRENDQGMRVFGELGVGRPQNGSELTIGEGDSFVSGMLVYTKDTNDVFVNVSSNAAQPSGSEFTFTGAGTGNAIYVSCNLPIDDSYYQFYGIKALVNTAAVLGAGSIIGEYWDGAAWTNMRHMSSKASTRYLPYAKQIFERAQPEQINFEPEMAATQVTNDPPSLGIGTYWIRWIIVDAPITTAPVFEQFKIHANRMEFNEDGYPTMHGKARTIGTLAWSMGDLVAWGSSPGNQDLYALNSDTGADYDIGVGREENSFAANSRNRISDARPLPSDIDTSGLITIELYWVGDSASAGDVLWKTSMGIVSIGDPITDAVASAPTDITGQAETSYLESIGINEEDKLRRTVFTFDVSEAIAVYSDGSSDIFWPCIISDGDNGLDDYPGTRNLVCLRGSYYKWNNGGHQ
ncbi:MAG: hypothetical protein GY820_39740 [Gammaproteobacteria bacterium]|nr:hypothetical protein [Gammaproteobacteria bacterium]